MIDPPFPLPPGLRHIDDETALAELPTKTDRMGYHAKRLPQIQFVEGSEGVQRYRAKFPEARAFHLNTGWTTASLPKPAGYDEALCTVVRAWFASDTALAESNRSVVGRLNQRLRSTLDPDRHFSVALSAGRLAKLADVFAEHGARLDTSKVRTMSDARAAVKVAKGLRSPGEPFAGVGQISDNQLIIGTRTFTVMQHHGHDSIKIALGGKRHWLRLDVAAAFVSAAGLSLGGNRDDNPHYLLSVAMRELVPDVEMSNSDPLAGVDHGQSLGELVPDVAPAQHSPADMVPLDPVPPTELVPNPLSSRERMAALIANRPRNQAHSPACTSDPDADPLSLS